MNKFKKLYHICAVGSLIVPFPDTVEGKEEGVRSVQFIIIN